MNNHEKRERANAAELAVNADTGSRRPSGLALWMALGVAFFWSLFQLWIASPLPYEIESDLLRFNGNQARSIHLAFAIFLVFVFYPFSAKAPRHYVPWIDWTLAIVASLSAAYYYFNYEAISDRVGAPIIEDMVVACIGVVLLLEAARRSLGLPLVICATTFLFYTFFGNLMPEIIEHKGYSLSEVVNHQWITTEGVFGVALGVSADFIFLFVLFGTMLEKAGAGNYFITLAFSLLGSFRGGPAKAAVFASGLTGIISGSSIANVVTTGTFTIPMMKRSGFSAEKAGAVEVAASVNGQIMPPVMGAAAFLMVEYVGISYLEVITHAFLPAVISYIGLLYIVHLEAVKRNLQGLPKRKTTATWLIKVLGFVQSFLVICGVAAVVYYGLGWIKPLAGDNSGWVIAALLALIYVGTIFYSAKFPALEDNSSSEFLKELPSPGSIFKTGLCFLLPVTVLIWSLMIERLSPGLSAFWASIFLMFIIVTKSPLDALFRHHGELKLKMISGGKDLVQALISGARNMASISIATATAGIIVGTVSQTSIGAVLADVVELLSFGHTGLMLLLVAFLCLVLGMGLPTTANYIVVSSLLATVVVELGAQNGLLIPVIAVHLFVFYFGLMADVTPPVGLGSFAASAISGGSPIRTGVVAFGYSMRTAILPFIFIYNSDLLLIDVTWYQGIAVFVVASVAMLVFTAAMQGFFLTKSHKLETLILLIAAFSLLRPDFWINQWVAPYQNVPVESAETVLADIPDGALVRFNVDGEDPYGNMKNFTAVINLPDDETLTARLDAVGLKLLPQPGKLEIDYTEPGSAAAQAGLEAFQIVKKIEIATQQPAKELVYIPVALLLIFVIRRQKKRQQHSETAQKTEPVAASE